MSEKKRLKYDAETLDRALHLIKNDGVAIRSVSKLLNIPKSTLQDKLKNRYRGTGNCGAPTVLSPEEEQRIVDWIIYRDDLGWPLNKKQLIKAIGELVEHLQRRNPFKAGVPGKNWYEGFIRRHPEVSQKITHSSKKVKTGITENDIRMWFNHVDEYLKNHNYHNILQDSTRIFNIDDAIFPLNDCGSESMAVLFAASGDGCLQPPMCVYPYKKEIPFKIVEKIPDHSWGLGRSETGQMTTATFYEYIGNILLPWIKKNSIQLPIILLLNGHKFDFNLHLCELCIKLGVILLGLLPNCIQKLQPLDIGLFYSLKNSWCQAVQRWKYEHPGNKLKREDFAGLLKNALDDSFTVATMQNAFKACGFYPFNPDNIDYSMLITATESTLDGDKSSVVENEHVKEDRHEENVEGINDDLFRKEIERRLHPELFQEFLDTNGEWHGEEKWEGLYEFWLNLKLKMQKKCH